MNLVRSGRAISRNRCFLPACRYETALSSGCNERGPRRPDCSPVAMTLGRVATIMGRTVPASCNQCGPAGAMIAVPSADVCGPLHLPAVPARTASPLARSLVAVERSGGHGALRPPEVGAVDPHPMQDDSQFAGDRDFG